MIYTLKYSSPLGGIVVACDGEALTGLWFEGQKYFGDTLPEQYEEKAVSYTHLDVYKRQVKSIKTDGLCRRA